MENELRLRLFWLVQLALGGLFVAELVFIISTWLKARVPGLPVDASRWQKLRAVGNSTSNLIFSRRIWRLLRALVSEGLVVRRLRQVSRRRWVVHSAIFGPWLVLGLFSTVTGVVVELLPTLGMSIDQVVSLPIIGQLYHADVWWVALVNEVLGLIMLGGMGFVLYRRLVQRDSQLRTSRTDTIVLALIVLILLSGYPTEVFRLLADYSAAGVFAPDPSMLPGEQFPLTLHDAWGPQWGFVGYLSAQVLGALKWDGETWRLLHTVAFWLHLAFCMALLYWLPFSRFFHVIASPFVAAYNTMLDRERRDMGRVATGLDEG